MIYIHDVMVGLIVKLVVFVAYTLLFTGIWVVLKGECFCFRQSLEGEIEIEGLEINMQGMETDNAFPFPDDLL
jgi:hypothetical protein